MTEMPGPLCAACSWKSRWWPWWITQPQQHCAVGSLLSVGINLSLLKCLLLHNKSWLSWSSSLILSVFLAILVGGWEISEDALSITGNTGGV